MTRCGLKGEGFFYAVQPQGFALGYHPATLQAAPFDYPLTTCGHKAA